MRKRNASGLRNAGRKFRGLAMAASALLVLAGRAEGGQDTETDLDDSAYARVLSLYVDETGLVDYAGLASNRADLDAFVRLLARLDPSSTARWSQPRQMALWINAYNALTLKAVLDHYPVKSIKDIGSVFNSVWDKLTFDVMGDELTLNEIEHDILRKRYADPRIHLAINCASMGCPPLLNQPFRADALDAQFARQAERFFADPAKFRIRRDKDTVYLSPVFKWFGTDFVPAYGARIVRPGVGARENAALNFAADHVPADDRAYLETARIKIKYLGYDWGLNTQ